MKKPAPKRFRGFCGTCYSCPHLDGSMPAVSRWMASHVRLYPGCKVDIYQLPAKLTAELSA